MHNKKSVSGKKWISLTTAIVAFLMVMIVPLISARETAVSLNPSHSSEAGKDGGGFLTGPNAGSPVSIALNYLEANREEYGLTAVDLTDLHTDKRYTKQSNFTQVELRQRLNGIEVYNGTILVNIAGDGSIINLHNQFVSDLASQANVAKPALSAEEAVNAAAAHLGLTPEGLAIEESFGSVAQTTLFNDAGISRSAIPAKLIYQPTRQGVRLAWNVEIYALDQQNWHSMRIDAVNGDVLSQNDFIIHEDFNQQAEDARGIDISQNYFQAAVLEGANEPAAPGLAANDYLVYEWPRESPLHNPQGPLAAPISGRTVQNAPWNDSAPAPLPSPFGWHDTNGAAGAEFTVTRGNNVNAYEDGNNSGFQPDCGASLDCGSSPLFDVDLTQSPDTYEAAAISNLFYWNNIIHDFTYLYGFDEAARNFQENNYGNGASGSDSVNAEAQDGSGTCNANFGTPGDGSNPTMQMYICGSRDGDFDNGVIAHEYGHGVSNRLTGGASVSCLGNSEQMGEGWSDWLAIMMTIEAGDLGTDSRGMGTYLIGEPSNGPGIRPNPYSTNFGINPSTYGDVGGLAVPHGVGYLWATMLWEMNWELINNGVSQSGLDIDLFNGVGGNNLTSQLVMDGMKLQPCSPGFVDGRDAILLADQNLTGGQNQCVIWDAFARRGLGYSADQGSSGSTGDGTEAFDLPPVCLQNLKITKTASPDPVEAGTDLTYTLTATNDTIGTLTGVVVEDTILADQTYVPGSATCGGSEAAGVVSFPIGTMNSGDSSVCTFAVTVDSGVGSTLFFFDNFEDGSLSNWTATGLWNPETESDTCGSTVSPFPSSNNAAYYGDDADCDFSTGSQTTGTLTMNSLVALTGSPILKFWSYEDTENNPTWDKKYAEISTNGGSSWSILGQLDSENTWYEVTFDLSAYAGSNALIRFRFDSTDSVQNGDLGWLVDDVEIIDEGSVSNTACVTANEGDNACASVSTLVTPSTCAVPDAVVDLAVSNPGGGSVDLSWSAATNADSYDVHRKANDPYFAPDGSSFVTNVAGTSHSLTGTGDVASNYSYVVVSKRSCGATAVSSNRVGEFDFTILIN